MTARTHNIFSGLGFQIVLLVAGCAMAAAGPIDVSSLNYVTLRHGSEMTVDFGVANYGRNNPDYSPYPTSLNFQIAGPDLPSAALSAVPGSSASYFTGYQLSGWLESMDGEMALPLYDSNAARLGLAAGSLLVTPGMSSGDRIAVISASRDLGVFQSEALFGEQGEARIQLMNSGADLTIGLGPGYTLRSAVSEPGVRGAGPVQTAGVTYRVAITNAPEPGTWLLIATGLIGLLLYTGAGWRTNLSFSTKHCRSISGR